MATITDNFSGKASLDELKRACENTQNTQKAKLVHCQGGINEAATGEDDKFFNQAQFVTVEKLKHIYDELIFVEVEDAGDIPSLVAGQMANRALLIFNETLIVQNKEKRVLGFGRFD